jgi:hypothetical protein
MGKVFLRLKNKKNMETLLTPKINIHCQAHENNNYSLLYMKT